MIGQLWFDSTDAMNEASKSPAWQACAADQQQFLAEQQIFAMAVKEHWVIGPEVRS